MVRCVVRLVAGNVLVVLVQHGLPLRGRGGVLGLHGNQRRNVPGCPRLDLDLHYLTLALDGERP